jgi:monoamine oxidase
VGKKDFFTMAFSHAKLKSPSRLEASIFLMQSVEARFPRLIPRKPILAGAPLDLFSLHQAILFFGGYRLVEKSGLWPRVAEQILPLQGSVSLLKTPSASKQQQGGPHVGIGVHESSSGPSPQAVAQIRDKALRYLAWIEDEAPIERVVDLQTIAKRYPMRPIPFESLTPNLQGNNVDYDLSTWMYEKENSEHCQDLAVSCGIPGISNILRMNRKEKNIPSSMEDESRKRDRIDEGCLDVLSKRRKGIDGKDESSLTVDDFSKGESSLTGAGISSNSHQPATSSHQLIPDFVRIVDVNSIHSDDASQLYKLYSIDYMLIGAHANHINPLDITDEEEIAFPHYSRAANASTIYSESQRRDTLRSNNAVLVIPSQGDSSNSIIIFALPPENDVNAIGAALMADKPLPPSMPILKGNSLVEGSNVSVLNNIIHTLSNQSLRVSSAPPVPRALMKIEDYSAISSSNGLSGIGVSTQTYESKKKTVKFDPLSKRLAEGVEHEPHVGLSVTRVQFLVDLRNHILLKWVQSQNPIEEGDYNVRQAGALNATTLLSSVSNSGTNYSTNFSLFQEAQEKDIGTSTPTHSAWNGSMKFNVIGKITPIASQQIQQSVGASAYKLPGPLMLREVLRTIPSRFHEAAAAVFDFLEGQAKINIGAISFRTDGTQTDCIPFRIPWNVFLKDELIPSISEETQRRRDSEKLNGPSSPPFKRKRIAIIGAGISGLSAARQLSFFGHDVVVIEAQDRPGGRIRTDRCKLGQPIDEGAMISTGAEPNPFALISRQLNLRTHEISNLEAPLLLPQSLRTRVNDMSSAREKRARIVTELKKRAVLQQEAQTRARNAVHVAALAAARARESLYSDYTLRKEVTSDMLSLDTGNIDHGVSSAVSSSLLSKGDLGISLPQDLSHISDAITAQVLRVYSAHAAFIAEHVIFLERVLKCLTSLSVAQFASRTECYPYGVVRLNQQYRPLLPATKQMLDSVHIELQNAKNWLTEPISKHVIDMIRQVSHDQLQEASKRTTPLEVHPQPLQNTIDSPNFLKADDVDDISLQGLSDSHDSTGVVLVPQSIDAEVAADHNMFLERAHQFRLKEVAPALKECLFSFPLLRGNDPINFVPLIKTPPSPPGFIVSGHEIVRINDTPPGRPNPNDPWTFSFISGSDGGVLGSGIKTWTTDVYPRKRVHKYADPRRTDDDVDGAFEHLDRVPGQASAISTSNWLHPQRPISTLNPQAGNLSSSSLSGPSQSTVPSTFQPRKIFWGSRSSWDCSLGLALEMMATADDAERVTCGGLRPDLANAVAALRLTSPDGDDTLDQLLSSSLALKDCDADTDGLMSSGSSLKGKHSQSELTFSALRRALLRWHAANLEYGCARPLSAVSLQSWDQDDVFGFHDKGKHTFSRDGYDTHIRGIAQGLPILYNSEVIKINWACENISSGAKITIKTLGDRNAGMIESESLKELAVDAIVVTLPIGVLQERHQTLFDPPLPEWKVEAIQGLNPGLLNKVMIRFPRAFWRKAATSIMAESNVEQKVVKAPTTSIDIVGKKAESNESRSFIRNYKQQHSSLSFLPLMESLTSLFHLQRTFLSDSRLISACSLALAASESDIVKSSNKSPSEILFSSIQSVRETSELKSAAVELRDKILSLPVQPNTSLNSEVTSDKLLEDAESVAERVFAIPLIPRAGSAISPSHLSPAAAAAAQRAVELADKEVSLRKETVNIISNLLKNSSDPLKSKSESKTHGISAGDDAFCRVVLGDEADDVRRRGESYMFWAMDRPGEGAQLKLIPDTINNPFTDVQGFVSENEESEGAVLIAMMAGAAAEWVEEVSDSVAVHSVMSTLRDLFGSEAVPEPVNHIVTRWKSNSFARGSYSSLAPESHGSAYDILAAPINHQGEDPEETLPVLFFAGEATNRHHPTTAAGAFDTGIREAVRISSIAGRARDPDVLRILAAREIRVR